MRLNIKNSQLLIGANSSTEHALNIPLVAPEQTTFTVNDISYVGNFFTAAKGLSSDEIFSEDKASRCLFLVKALLSQVVQAGVSLPIDTPIYWLLPEFSDPLTSAPDTQEQQDKVSNNFSHFIRQLREALPSLFTHAQSQLFPFGRAAFPIALAAAKTLFENNKGDQSNVEQGNPSTITFISVDSLINELPKLIADNSLVTSNSEHGITPAEGAIFSQISCTESGISVDLIENKVAPSKQRNTTVKELFQQSSAYFSTCHEEQGKSLQGNLQQGNIQENNASILSHLYLPGNGDESLQQPWLDAYYQLADCVDGKTSICQSALFTGELGCVTGLYNFLHIANGYKNQMLKGNVLQLEVSNALHQGIALYSWSKHDL